MLSCMVVSFQSLLCSQYLSRETAEAVLANLNSFQKLTNVCISLQILLHSILNLPTAVDMILEQYPSSIVSYGRAICSTDSSKVRAYFICMNP